MKKPHIYMKDGKWFVMTGNKLSEGHDYQMAAFHDAYFKYVHEVVQDELKEVPKKKSWFERLFL